MLMQTQYECAQGLVGETLTVSGLGENQSSALLRVNLADGIFHQAVFTASEPSSPFPRRVRRAVSRWITPGWVRSTFGRAPITCCL